MRQHALTNSCMLYINYYKKYVFFRHACSHTWSEHQYQTAETVRPNNTPMDGKLRSSTDRNKWNASSGGKPHCMWELLMAFFSKEEVGIAVRYWCCMAVYPPTRRKAAIQKCWWCRLLVTLHGELDSSPTIGHDLRVVYTHILIGYHLLDFWETDKIR